MRCGRPRRPMGSTTRPISPRCRSGSATRTSPPRGSTIPAHAAGGQSDLQGGVLRDDGPPVAQAWGFLWSGVAGPITEGSYAALSNLIALVNDAMHRKVVIVRPIPRNDRLGTASQGGEFLLPSGLMAAGHDDRIIGSDVSSSFSVSRTWATPKPLCYTTMWKRCAMLPARQWTGCCARNTLSPTSPRFQGSRRHGHHAMVPNRTRFSAFRRHLRCRRQVAS